MDPSNFRASRRRYTVDIDDKFHPRTVTLVKDKSGFGFTLRHFIVYPPTSFNGGKEKKENNEDPLCGLAHFKSDYKNKPMDTIFIREVKEGSPAHNAGLNKGDRILAINNYPLTGKSYSDIIHLILRSGQTLRLLVVPKEDDILQLYFASSAYQPVYRDKNKLKYVSSSDTSAGQSNQLYRQSTYGTYPGRIHNKLKSSNDKPSDDTIPVKSIFKSPVSPDSNQDIGLSDSVHFIKDVDKKDYASLPSECIYQSGCFSEDESHYNNSKELGHNSFCTLQPPKLKDTVENLYYNLCHNQHQSVFPYSSEENLNYPIYMSDFDTVNCDNMEESRSVSETLNMASENISDSTNVAYQSERPRYIGMNHSCDKVRDLSYTSASDSHISSIWTNNKMSRSVENTSNPEAVISTEQLYSTSGECSSLPADFNYGDNSDSYSINFVAQRKHQFESGNHLAESMERMNLYRSELSRMSKPNQIRLVSTRTAEFENKSQTPITSPNSLKKLDEFQSKKDFKVNSTSQIDQSNHLNYTYDLLDRQNRNKLCRDESSNDLESLSQVQAFSDAADFSSVVPSVVHRRKTVPVSSDQDECHIVRRISYLRATANDRMNVESDLSEEDEVSDASSPNKEYRIQKLKSFFGEKTPKVKQAMHPLDIEDSEINTNEELSEESKSVYGWVICKVVSLEGKRSSDRSWRHLWAILRNNILYLLKERREPSKGTLTGDEHVINVKYSIAKVASDYVKRKHVLRLMLLNGTEYLVQTESHTSMMEWLKALQIFAKEITELPDWLKNTSVLEKAAAYEQTIQTNKSKASQQHPVKKLVFRHRNPSESSPSVKTRRASQGDELALTKIGILWRDRMVQGWKRVHGSNVQVPKGASFGVKLETTPPGVTNEHVPLIVELCIQIVESRGLDVVGIYRVPGNNASVSVLTDMVNQGIDDVVLQDARWNDVNIVSSLLKAFFRKLPEPLLTSHLYPKFIQASKIDDPVKRLKAIKHVLYHLPVHYFATLRYLMYHLKKVVEHSATNKMEARNLAIVFGPTLVRTTDNNMVTMVTDMSHQCYLIESMILYAEWLFEDTGDIMPLELNAQDKRKTHPPSTMQSTALLSNINKLDENAFESLPHEMLASIYNATRHLRHRHKKKDSANNAKKRSGIIADDTDIFAEHNKNYNNIIAESVEPSIAEQENISDVSFGSCSSLISGSSKTKQRRSISKEVEPRIDPEILEELSLENHDTKSGASEEVAPHSYNELNALAHEKIKNFELETKALLRRDVHKPRVSVGTPQVEWEQIEREWQKAKLELEQEDLLDYLADDPSYLSCLLNREGFTDISPANDAPVYCKTALCGISCSPKELQHSNEPSKLSSSVSSELVTSFQRDKPVLNQETDASSSISDTVKSKYDHNSSKLDQCPVGNGKLASVSVSESQDTDKLKSTTECTDSNDDPGSDKISNSVDQTQSSLPS